MAYSKEYYGKRPLWQWVVIYLVIGGLIYGLVYYFILAKRGGYSTSPGSAPLYPATGSTTNPTYIAPTTAPQTTTAPSTGGTGGGTRYGY